MAHTCPSCGQCCYCLGDIDDICFGERYDCICCMDDDDDFEDVDDEWDDESEEAFKKTKISEYGGIIDPDNTNITHYP